MRRKERDKEVTVGKKRMNGSGERTDLGGMRREGSSDGRCGRGWRRGGNKVVDVEFGEDDNVEVDIEGMRRKEGMGREGKVDKER